MKSLIIETSTERAVVALYDGEKEQYLEHLPQGLRNSNYLMPAIQRGLEYNHLKTSDLECVISGIGPGSYTGIRVGAMVAKTLAWSAGLPLVGISTLKCFVPEEHGPFAVLMDAKVSGVFIIKGMIDGEGEVNYHSEGQVLAIDALDQELDGIQKIISPHTEAIQRRWQGKDVSWEEVSPHTSHMARQALKKWKKGEYSEDGTLKLQYLRSHSYNPSCAKNSKIVC